MVDLARELSGRVNEAYAVLGDDLRRAEYIVRFFSFLFFSSKQAKFNNNHMRIVIGECARDRRNRQD